VLVTLPDASPRTERSLPLTKYANHPPSVANLNPTCRIILAVSIRDSEGYQCPKHGENNFFLSRFFLGENLLDVTTLKSRNRQFPKPFEKPLSDISSRPLGIGCQLSKCLAAFSLPR
jgi:hypothetical protein